MLFVQQPCRVGWGWKLLGQMKVWGAVLSEALARERNGDVMLLEKAS